jgi:hypothetical protein
MTNGADQQLDSFGPSPAEDQGSLPGPVVSEQSGGNSSGHTLLPNPQSDESRLAGEWDSYIDSQKRHDWIDLSNEERAFATEYLENGYNHREAAEAVGRAASGAFRLLNKPLVREYIHFTESSRRARRIVSERFLDAQLSQLYDQSIGLEEIDLVTGSGLKLRAKKHQGQLALAIIQERAKLSGVAKPEQADTQVNVIINEAALIGVQVNKIDG